MTHPQLHHFKRSGPDGYVCGKCGAPSESPSPTDGCTGDPNPSIFYAPPVLSEKLRQELAEQGQAL